jgi:hypothetical protein
MATINALPAVTEVEREPTRGIETPRQESGAAAPGVELVRGPTPSLSSQTDTLLLNRLRWVAFLMVLAYGIAMIWVLATRDDLHQPMVVLLGLRVTLAMVILGLLFGELASSPSHLRWAELALFGGLTVCLVISQCLIGRDLVRAGDISGVLAHGNDGLLELLILIFAYGVLIPNAPGRSAGVVLTMALAPFLALAILLVNGEISARVLADLRTIELVGRNALIVLIGAGLAIHGGPIREHHGD